MTEEERETAFARIGLACSGRSWHGNQCPFLSKIGDSSALYYTALDQWEVSTGNRLAQSIETIQNTEFRWLDPGKTLVSAEPAQSMETLLCFRYRWFD